jgi:fermentation-respiration switch protein FrsA (DUF1100 family)
MLKRPLLLLLLLLLLTVCGTPKPSYVSPDEYFLHATQGDIYKIAGKEPRPTDAPRLKALADSARRSSPNKDHSVTLSDSDGTRYALGVGLPRGFDRAGKYPLIIYLHGGVGTDISTKGARAWEMLGGLRDCVGVILASPSANRFAPWWSPRGLGRIAHAVRYINIMYDVDTAKIFLAGVSDGATGCYAAASAMGEAFAGFFAVSGYGGMLNSLGAPLSVDKMKNRPIYNIQGGQDKLYPISAVSDFINALQKNGVPITSKVYPEEGHGFDYKEQEFSELARLVNTWSR